MSTAELVEHLKRMSNPERLAVIEAATRLIREGFGADRGCAGVADEEAHLRATALAVQDFYEPGGDHTEWTELDPEDVLDGSVPG